MLYRLAVGRARVWQHLLLGLADTRVINKIASTRRRRNLHEDRARWKIYLITASSALAVDIILPRIIKLPRGLTVRSLYEGKMYLGGGNQPPFYPFFALYFIIYLVDFRERISRFLTCDCRRSLSQLASDSHHRADIPWLSSTCCSIAPLHVRH